VPVSAAAVVVAAVGALDGLLYVLVMRSQDDEPSGWFVAVLSVAVALALYGSVAAAKLGPAALTVAGLLLLVVGVLGILSIGLPLVVAGGVALVTAARRRPPTPVRAPSP
jgi:hypothetical protein